MRSSPAEIAAARRRAEAAALARRALSLLRSGDLREAWLLADCLCRRAASADAYFLRATALARLGAASASRADLRMAVLADPASVIVNRALLASEGAAERRQAALRLLRAGEEADRKAGFSALAADGYDCVGALDLIDGRLRGWIAWNGPSRLPVALQTDESRLEISIDPQRLESIAGFRFAARLDLPVPPETSAVRISAATPRALIEPAVHLCQPAPAILGQPDPISDRTGPAGLLVVVPVYDDRDATRACFESLFAAMPADVPSRIVAIDDATPDRAIAADLRALERTGRIVLLRNPFNLGFAASVNRALALREGSEDVLLLNADTLLPPKAIERLLGQARQAADIGTVTPLSNNGEDTSFPLRGRANQLPEADEIAAIDAIAAAINIGQSIEMPNGVGFCMLMTDAALRAAGGFSVDYGRGYFEDVDFCLRAARAGLRNICAVDTYVGHAGGRSFGDAKRILVARNRRRLAMRHPGYLATVQAFERTDPLRTPIARIEEECLRLGSPFDLLAVPADMPPATRNALIERVRMPDRPPVLLRWQNDKDGLRISCTEADEGNPQNIVLHLGTNAADALVSRLAGWPLRTCWLANAGSADVRLVEGMARCTPDFRTIEPALFDPPRVISERKGPSAAPTVCDPESADLLMLLEEGEDGQDLVARVSKNLAASPIPGRLLVCGGASHLPAGSRALRVGPLVPQELDGWLGQLRPRAVFLASRKWGASDPRAEQWARLGMPVAWFAEGGEIAAFDPPHLRLSGRSKPGEVAGILARWFADFSLKQQRAVRLRSASR